MWGTYRLKMAFDIVLGTVSEFIEIAETITAIFIIYYLFRFLFFEDKNAKDTDAAWNKQGSDAREAIGKLMKDHKVKKEHKEKLDGRKKYLDKSLGYLHLALEAAQDLQERLHTQNKDEINKAKSGVGKLKSNLSTARRNTRGAHRHHKDDLTEDLRELHAAIDAVFENCKDLLEENIPHDEEDKHYAAKAQLFRHGANKISKYIAGLYSSVHKFIEHHEQKKLEISASLKHLEETVAHHKAQAAARNKEHETQGDKKQVQAGVKEDVKELTGAQKAAQAQLQAEARKQSGQPAAQKEHEFVEVARGRPRPKH